MKDIFGLLFGIGLLMMMVGGFFLLYFIYNFQYTQYSFPVIISASVMSIGLSSFFIGFMNLNKVEVN